MVPDRMHGDHGLEAFRLDDGNCAHTRGDGYQAALVKYAFLAPRRRHHGRNRHHHENAAVEKADTW